MPPEDSQYPAQWTRIAEKDLRRVQKLLADYDPELAGFCLQQCVEKFLKAALLSKGWKLRRIHSLDTLLDDLIPFDDFFSQFRLICIRITAFYFSERYPSLETTITEKDVQDALQSILPLIEKIRQLLK
ncbi:MAG: HEPN domain-containing protein [Verrucomicrobia bacterium]|nr:HEPN domain-containing protein [Verrucomicrobiota bacterium]